MRWTERGLAGYPGRGGRVDAKSLGDLSQDLIKVLYLLLPGFVVAWVFYGLSAYVKPSNFERVVQALVFNLFVRGTLYGVHESLIGLGRVLHAQRPWDSDSEAIWTVAIALFLGVLFACLANHDWLHWLLRKAQITAETSYPSEWYSAFKRNSGNYIVLHLKGSRRLLGFPDEWPTSPERGYFRIWDAVWLGETRASDIPLDGVENVLIPVSEVEMIEFKPPKKVEIKEECGGATNG